MNALLARHIYPLSVESSKVGEYSEVAKMAKMQNCRALSFQLGIKMHLEAIKPYGGFSAKKTASQMHVAPRIVVHCSPLLTICPRCCPRHALYDAPDMPQMMPQTCPR